ncbi:MAG TPA: hypothetical protein DCE42_14210 [Myxococcales bacterium]|nr:hypothetical protein [Deltaproteobacteria bacterium]HAA55913.1 hypothetical protein [Myxococcales bacterium]|tara:strand:- start:28271 stop:29851 length:1581 start_codon:yes stop_codon:yes gene_type:complete
MTTHLNECRALLSEAPSLEQWNQLCELFDRWQGRDDFDVGLQYALRHLEAWPDKLRVAPWRWLDQLKIVDLQDWDVERWDALDVWERLEAEQHARKKDISIHPAWPLVRHLNIWAFSKEHVETEIFSSISRCAFEGSEIGSEEIALLAQCSLPQLKELSLIESSCGGKAAQALAECSLPQLEALELDFMQLDRDGLDALLQAPFLPQLHKLHLSGLRLNVSHFGTLAMLPFSRLQELDVSFHSHLEDWVFIDFFQHARLAALTSLSLQMDFTCSDKGLDALCASKEGGGQPFRALNLRSTGISDEGVKRLCAHPCVDGLEELDVSNNFSYDKVHDHYSERGVLTDASAFAIANSPYTYALKTLHLEQNVIGAKGVEAIAQSPQLQHLEELYLEENPIGVEGVRALAASPHMGRLKLLSLSYVPLGDEGGIALCQAASIRGVEQLFLSGCQLGDAFLEEFAKYPWEGLRGLFLNSNDITDEGVAQLAKCSWLSSLEMVSFDFNHGITRKGRRLLKQSPYIRGVRVTI